MTAGEVKMGEEAMEEAPPSERVTVLVIAESPHVRQRTCRVLSAEPSLRVLGAVGAASSALEQIARCRPSVVVTTSRIGGVVTKEFIRRIDGVAPRCRVLVIGNSTRQEAVLDTLRSGARGYVVSATADAELPSAVAAVAANQAWLSPSVAGHLIDEFVHLPSTLLRDSVRAGTYLTQREQSVLTRLALGSTNREIAEALDVAETTVKTHVTSILEKLRARNRLEAASIALKLARSASNATASSATFMRMSSSANAATMDPSLWRDLMSVWPSGVCVLTSLGTLGPRGCTVNSLTSVSPGLVIVCFNLESNTLSAVRETGRFCINFLGGEHEELSRRFAEKDHEIPRKFEGIDYRVIDGAPVLAQHNAWMICAVESQFPAGDYAVMLARPLVGGREGSTTPLVFCHGGYWELKREAAT